MTISVICVNDDVLDNDVAYLVCPNMTLRPLDFPNLKTTRRLSTFIASWITMGRRVPQLHYEKCTFPFKVRSNVANYTKAQTNSFIHEFHKRVRSSTHVAK